MYIKIFKQPLLFLCDKTVTGVRGAVFFFLTSGLLLEISEVLRNLRHYLREQSQGHHAIDRPEKRGVERGSARRLRT